MAFRPVGLALAVLLSAFHLATLAEAAPSEPAKKAGPRQLLCTIGTPFRRKLYLIRENGTGLRRLTRNPKADEEGASWSPDGRRIAFGRKLGNGRRHLYVMNANGGNRQRLTNDPTGDDSIPSWSPDGKKILFVRAYSDVHANLFIVEVKTRKLKRLTEGDNFDADPAWSPDGRTLLFGAKRAGEVHLYVMDANGENERQIGAKETNFGLVFPAWFPDGSKIAYTEKFDAPLEIFVSGLEGEGKKQITNLGGYNFLPAWSRNGDTLAFEHYDSRSSRGSLWLVDANGNNQRVLIRDIGGWWAGRPAWRPR